MNYHKTIKNCYCAIFICRSPTQLHCQSNTVQIENFITKFDELLQSLYQCNSNVFAFLDANINLLKVANSKHASDYIGTIHSNGFLQLISKATRISGDSYSLIDHILCKNFYQSYKTSTLIADISDHFINCISLPNSSKSTKKQNCDRATRIFSSTNMQNFRNDLHSIRWDDVLRIHETNESFDIFWEKFITLFELHFPKIQIKK